MTKQFETNKMKSKKAKQYIDGFAKAGAHHFYEKDVIRAVEIAEAEAMEQAIWAASGLCMFKAGQSSKCRLSDFHTKCDLIKDCSLKNDFARLLDSPKTNQT